MAFALKLAQGAPGEIDERVAAPPNPRARVAARPQAAPALGRPAAAGRAGPRHRPRPAGVPVRRAALEPRRQAAGADARRDQGAAPAAQDHHGLRHPRPDRGHDHGRPHRRHEQGDVQQVGAPLELYDRPANLFVAGFIGTPPMNFIDATCARERRGRGRRPRRHAAAVAGRAGARSGRNRLRRAARASRPAQAAGACRPRWWWSSRPVPKPWSSPASPASNARPDGDALSILRCPAARVAVRPRHVAARQLLPGA